MSVSARNQIKFDRFVHNTGSYSINNDGQLVLPEGMFYISATIMVRAQSTGERNELARMNIGTSLIGSAATQTYISSSGRVYSVFDSTIYKSSGNEAINLTVESSAADRIVYGSLQTRLVAIRIG